MHCPLLLQSILVSDKVPRYFRFYCAIHVLRRARYCYGQSSVCLSVTLSYRDHIGWNTSKISLQLVSLSLGFTVLFADPNIMDLF